MIDTKKEKDWSKDLRIERTKKRRLKKIKRVEAQSQREKSRGQRRRKAESVEVERRELETEKVWKCEKKIRAEEALPLWPLWWMWLSRFVSLFHVPLALDYS